VFVLTWLPGLSPELAQAIEHLRLEAGPTRGRRSQPGGLLGVRSILTHMDL